MIHLERTADKSGDERWRLAKHENPLAIAMTEINTDSNVTDSMLMETKYRALVGNLAGDQSGSEDINELSRETRNSLGSSEVDRPDVYSRVTRHAFSRCFDNAQCIPHPNRVAEAMRQFQDSDCLS